MHTPSDLTQQLATVDHLCQIGMQEMGGRLWRNREASCLAMTDLIQVNPTPPSPTEKLASRNP